MMTVAMSNESLKTSGQRNKPDSVKQENDDERNGPIADYEAVQPEDRKKREKRRKKNGRFPKHILEERPNSNQLITSNEWLHRLPAFPIALSDAVVLGQVVKAQAYLSENKTGLFSEFTVRIEEIFKNESLSLFAVGDVVDTEREGGRIRYSSGHIQQYIFQDQGMPRVGGRYVLFLRRTEQGETPYILTVYELRAGRVFPVDGMNVSLGGGNLPRFAAYENAEESAFLKSLRDAIARQVQASPEEVK